MSRKPFVGGNWKCNGTVKSVEALIGLLNNGGEFPSNAEVLVSPPSLFLSHCRSSLRSDILVSAQDVGINGNGAFTGELSAPMLVDSGINWTLVGHSERRIGFGFPGEPHEVVGKKCAVALAAGLSVIVCIGEKLAERESGATMDVCTAQLSAVSALLSEKDWDRIVIAYEPVWAIGTGVVATPEQAENTHADIRRWISSNVGVEIAEKVRIIYGGSVKGNNCEQLIQCPNIDGFLVGGASLLPEFIDIIKCTAGKA